MNAALHKLETIRGSFVLVDLTCLRGGKLKDCQNLEEFGFGSKILILTTQ